MKYSLIQFQHRTQLIHKQMLIRKWETGVCPNQEGSGGSLSTTSCFAFTSLAKMNKSLLQGEPIFLSLHSSVVMRFQTNASNHVQLAATKGMVSCSRMALLAHCGQAQLPATAFTLCPNTDVTPSHSHLHACEFSPCFKDLMPDSGNEISLLAFKIW